MPRRSAEIPHFCVGVSHGPAETEVIRCEGYLKDQWHPVSARTCALHLISYRR